MPEKIYTTPPEELPSSQTTQYSFQRQLLHKPGLHQMPAAGPEGTPCLFVRDHAPYEVEVVTWTASNEAGPPKIPNPYGPDCDFGLNDNRVLLDFKLGAIVPTGMGGATAGKSWSMSGVYVYGKFQPEVGSGQVNNVPLGKIWYEDGAVDANYFPADHFIQGTLDPNFPTPLYAMPEKTGEPTFPPPP